MEGSVLGNLWKGGFSFIQAFALSHPEYCCPWAGGEWQGRGPSRSHCACVSCRHQLETPGHYSHLAAFYEDKKGVLHAGPGRGGGLPPVYWLPSIHRYVYPEMKVGQPESHAVPGLGLGTVVADCCFHE